jgi:hypothetical protein
MGRLGRPRAGCGHPPYLVPFLESLNCDGVEALIDDAQSATGSHRAARLGF